MHKSIQRVRTAGHSVTMLKWLHKLWSKTCPMKANRLRYRHHKGWFSWLYAVIWVEPRLNLVPFLGRGFFDHKKSLRVADMFRLKHGNPRYRLGSRDVIFLEERLFNCWSVESEAHMRRVLFIKACLCFDGSLVCFSDNAGTITRCWFEVLL